MQEEPDRVAIPQDQPLINPVGSTPNIVARFRALIFNPPPSVMPSLLPTEEIIEISDDDSDISDNKDRVHQLPLRSMPLALNPTLQSSASNVRPNPDTSPLSRRDSKRPRLDVIDDDNDALVVIAEASGSRTQSQRRPQIPCDDDDLFMYASPAFFDDAFPADYRDDMSSSSIETAAALLLKAANRSARRPPYFHDPLLNIRMYCGLGHKQFPVPVDSNPKFQLACSAWDARQGTDDDDGGEESDAAMTLLQQDCLARILDVFPDIEHDFVLRKIKSQHELIRFPDEEVEMHPDSAAIINDILEMESYPKQKTVIVDTKTQAFQDRLGEAISWTQAHRVRINYQKDAITILANQFDRVPMTFIHSTVKEKANLFDAYLIIEEIEANYFQHEQPYKRSKTPRDVVDMKNRGLNPRCDPSYYCNLVVELQAAKQEALRKQLLSNQQQQEADAETANLEQHRIDGLLVQCGCCFDEELPLNRAVVCQAFEEHYFCYGCVKGLAESQIGLKKYQMQCMDESGCSLPLDQTGIGKAVPIKTFDRLQFNQQQAEIKAANIEGLEQCPFCDFQAICDTIEVDSSFACQNPDCFKVTCRKCNEISHPPKTCEEVKLDRGLSARHKVEEARSKAMIRTCPSCRSAIIKSDGCNKMRCTCGAAMCYVCKQDLGHSGDAYAHFHNSGGTCPLYDKRIDRHAQEANEAEEQAIRDAKAVDETIEESTLRIETGKSKGKAKATKKATPNTNRRGRARERRHDQVFEVDRAVDDPFDRDGDQHMRFPGRGHRPRGFLRDNDYMDWLRGVREGAHIRRAPVLAGVEPPALAPAPALNMPLPGQTDGFRAQPLMPAFHNALKPQLPQASMPHRHGDNDFNNPFPGPAFNINFMPTYPYREQPPGPQPPPQLNNNGNIYADAYLETAQRVHGFRDEQDRRRRALLERRKTLPIEPAPVETDRSPPANRYFNPAPLVNRIDPDPTPYGTQPQSSSLFGDRHAYPFGQSANVTNSMTTNVGPVPRGTFQPSFSRQMNTHLARPRERPDINPNAQINFIPQQSMQQNNPNLSPTTKQEHTRREIGHRDIDNDENGNRNRPEPRDRDRDNQNTSVMNRGRPFRRQTVDSYALGSMYGLH